MKRKVQVGLIIISLFFLNENIFSQTNNWKTKKTKDGKITVRNRISKRISANGKEEQMIEYIATTITNASIQKLISIMKDVSKHKEFMSQKVSINVKTLSDNECVVYYFHKGIWPYPSSDIVAKMIFNEDIIKRVTTFTITAAPSMLNDKGVKRLEYYDLTYLFKDLDNGKVEITIVSKFTPAVQLPAFIINTWFPDGPADYLTGIIKLANNSK